MTRQEQRWAKRYLKFSAAAIFLLLLTFFSQSRFHPQRADLHQQLKNQPAPTAAQHRLSMRHIGGMHQHDTFYLRRSEL